MRSYRRTVTDRDGSSPDDEVRLRELAEFLRERRARLDPEQLGLPARRRRRTPGLRREDVAERAAVSIAWYASLEQGRPVNPSKAVVSSLADALCLSDLDDTTANPVQAKTRLTKTLKSYAAKGGNLGMYWVDQTLIIEWVKNLQEVGFNPVIVESVI